MLLMSQLQIVKHAKPTYHLAPDERIFPLFINHKPAGPLLQNSKQSLIVTKDCRVLKEVWSQMVEESTLHHEICWPLTT